MCHFVISKWFLLWVPSRLTHEAFIAQKHFSQWRIVMFLSFARKTSKSHLLLMNGEKSF